LAVATEDDPCKRLLYSEDEVRNPGYPGALMFLGVSLALLGVLTCVRSVLRGDVAGALISPLLPLIPGVYLIVKSVRAQRAQRREAWMCERCDYDRRGVAKDAACPECGTVPSDILPS
jgi:hypothetical protein